MRAPFSRTFFDLIAEMAQRDPLAIAIIDRGQEITYGDLVRRAGLVAAALRRTGTVRGDRIGVLLDNRREWLEIVLGAAALGCTVVPISTWVKQTELEFILTDASVNRLFLVDNLAGQSFGQDLETLREARRVPPFEHVICVGDGKQPEWSTQPKWLDYEAFIAPANEGAASFEALPPGEGPSAGDTMFILYTSGSSNRPKAVPLVQGSAIENGFNIGERMGLTSTDRMLVSVPLFWSYGAVNALPATLTHGATLVLQSRFEPAGALDLIERHKCTALYTLPAMTTALVGHPEFSRERTRSLRTGLTIGSPQDVVKAANELGAAQICNIYGSTETYGNCCVAWHHWPLDKRASCQGEPLPGVTLRIVHPEARELCAPGETGEVEVAGYLTHGYTNASADQNEAAFTDEGYFKTGDLGYRTPDGAFVFAGRSSEIIKRSGINVSPAEVEEVLQQHPDVGLAGVVGLADAERGELIIAHVVAKSGATPEPAALVEHCKRLSSRYKVPDRIEIVTALPLTPTGKVMRRELRAIVEKAGKS